jgi:hypothetical protein
VRKTSDSVGRKNRAGMRRSSSLVLLIALLAGLARAFRPCAGLAGLRGMLNRRRMVAADRSTRTAFLPCAARASAAALRYGRAHCGSTRMSALGSSGEAAAEAAAARRAAYLRERDEREQRLVPKRVDMEELFGEDSDTCPEYIARWGGMHRQVAMEGPTRKALEMAVDSEWCADSWTETPTVTEEGTVTPS